MDSDLVDRYLLILGLAIALVGAALLLITRIPPIGRLPGDISFHRDDFSFFFPVMICVVLSVVLTVMVNIVIRLFR